MQWLVSVDLKLARRVKKLKHCWKLSLQQTFISMFLRFSTEKYLFFKATRSDFKIFKVQQLPLTFSATIIFFQLFFNWTVRRMELEKNWTARRTVNSMKNVSTSFLKTSFKMGSNQANLDLIFKHRHSVNL